MNDPAPFGDPNLAMVEIVVKALGDVADEVVLVGGCATGLLITRPRSQRIRATLDIDLVAEATSIHDYHEIERRLLLRGFRHDTSPDAPICRWVGSGITVDLLPSQAGVLAFHNQWYPLAVASAQRLTLPSERTIRLVAAPVFVATKIVAFRDRGRGDFLASHDLEDIISIVDGRATLVDELADSEPELRSVPDNLTAMAGSMPLVRQSVRLVPLRGGRTLRTVISPGPLRIYGVGDRLVVQLEVIAEIVAALHPMGLKPDEMPFVYLH